MELRSNLHRTTLNNSRCNFHFTILFSTMSEAMAQRLFALRLPIPRHQARLLPLESLGPGTPAMSARRKSQANMAFSTPISAFFTEWRGSYHRPENLVAN